MTLFSPHQIKKAAQALSERYRAGETPYLRTLEDRSAYLVTRLPATQAVLRQVLREISGYGISSYLDIGAGPGGSWDVVASVFPNVERATFLELDREFVRLGKQRLSREPITWINESAVNLNIYHVQLKNPNLNRENFRASPNVDFSNERGIKLHDMVLFSYSWGEIKNLAVLMKAWELCHRFLVVIEPGTPRGYASMLEARDELIKRGAHVVAPCPHNRVCPWEGSSQWCHFGVRLERSSEHQWAKEGSRGFEDEKFSYIILSKEKTPPFAGRMVKDLLRRKGHTILTLCTEKEIETKIISKKNDQYKSINKLNWGDKIIDNI
jgi:ribosomal protein RSM22 (predicted rRNA methylase)